MPSSFPGSKNIDDDIDTHASCHTDPEQKTKLGLTMKQGDLFIVNPSFMLISKPTEQRSRLADVSRPVPITSASCGTKDFRVSS